MASSNSLPVKIRGILQPDIQSTNLILTDLPIQLAKENTDEHLIKVYATAPCAGELLWAKNFPDAVPNDHPMVPCFDLSGIVMTAPSGSKFPPGTEIYTRTPASRTGNAREYTIATTSELAVKPKNLSWAEAASVPLSAFTAYQALFVHGGLSNAFKDPQARAENAKKRVLITAAAGGVGVLAVQLAKAAGVKHIIGIAGPDNVDFVKELGASEVVDYRRQSLGAWAKENEKVDLIFDLLGGQTLENAWMAVKEGGILVGINTPPNMKPVVDSVWKMEQFEEAFAKVAGGHSRGKVIITVRE
jgi:NADPH:quinone reductase-like Zn-dependent oxidoreductase